MYSTENGKVFWHNEECELISVVGDMENGVIEMRTPDGAVIQVVGGSNGIVTHSSKGSKGSKGSSSTSFSSSVTFSGIPTKADTIPVPKANKTANKPILDLLDEDRLHLETVTFDVEAFTYDYGKRGFVVFRRFADQSSEEVERRIVRGPDWWWGYRCTRAQKRWNKLYSKGFA